MPHSPDSKSRWMMWLIAGIAIVVGGLAYGFSELRWMLYGTTVSADVEDSVTSSGYVRGRQADYKTSTTLTDYDFYVDNKRYEGMYGDQPNGSNLDVEYFRDDPSVNRPKRTPRGLVIAACIVCFGVFVLWIYRMQSIFAAKNRDN